MPNYNPIHTCFAQNLANPVDGHGLAFLQEMIYSVL
jgi:hypothetical protein